MEFNSATRLVSSIVKNKEFKHVKNYWDKEQHVFQFLEKLRKNLNLRTIDDWNLLTQKQIILNGGRSLLSKYSLFDIKCMGYPEGKLNFTPPAKKKEYWDKKENISQFLSKLKEKYNLQSFEDWNLLTQKQIKQNGGSGLLQQYSMYEIKCIGYPEGKNLFKVSKEYHPKGYWDKKENIENFLSQLKAKYNLQSFDDWNSLTANQIQSIGGKYLLLKYSLHEIKCFGFPNGTFETTRKPKGYWDDKTNIIQFLDKLKKNYKIERIEDWNKITQNEIKACGGNTLLNKYSIYQLKNFAQRNDFSEENMPKDWDTTNIYSFIQHVKDVYGLNSPEDWNSISREQILVQGGKKLLQQYSVKEIKCLGCPEGESLFLESKTLGFWNKEQNIKKFFGELKEKYNLNTVKDWDSITQKQIKANGGRSLLLNYSMYEIKCLGFPEGKEYFTRGPNPKGFWDDKKNVILFLDNLKQKCNLQTPDDWNLITRKQIQFYGGGGLSQKYSLYELKCLGCPEGKLIFNNYNLPKRKNFWNNEINRIQFFNDLKQKYNIKTPEDWKRLSKKQLLSNGGFWLFKDKEYLKNLFNDSEHEDSLDYISNLSTNLEYRNMENQKRSSQRWLFLQVQKIFPDEEIVEDYFHSELSRETGFSVQFDVFLIHRNIAIEYHGKHHYEDIPSGFSPNDMYKKRDQEKEQLCLKYGIQLITIPYWWDNKIDSLRETLNSKINIKDERPAHCN